MIVVIVVIVMIVMIVMIVLFVVAGSFTDVVVIALQAAPELDSDSSEVEFLISEGGNGGLACWRGESFRSSRGEITSQRPGTELARQPSGASLCELSSSYVATIQEGSMDTVDSALVFELVVPPVGCIEADLKPLDQPVVQVCHAHVKSANAST